MNNHLQSLIETTPCSICMGTNEVFHKVNVDNDNDLFMWLPCVCVTPEEPNEQE